HAVGRRAVHVGLLRERHADGFQITVLSRRDERNLACRGRHGGRKRETRQQDEGQGTFHHYSSVSTPVLSPIFSCGAPTMRVMLMSTFVNGVSFEYFRLRLPFSRPHAPPTSRVGMSSALCRSPSPRPVP